MNPRPISASSRNILLPSLAKNLNLVTTPTPSFPIMVGNRDHIFCSWLCSNVPLIIQSHAFKVLVYLFLILGAELIFGNCLVMIFRTRHF